MAELIGVKGQVGTSFVRADKVVAIQPSPTGGTAIVLDGGQTVVTSESTTVVAGRIKTARTAQKR